MRTSVLVLTAMVGAGLLASPASLQERLVVGDSPYQPVEKVGKFGPIGSI